MELKKYDKPEAIEHLLFEVDPDLVDKFVELDFEIWTKKLSQYPGFLKKETWVSKDKPGEVATIIYWSDYDLWKAIDHNVLIEVDKVFTEKMGEGTFKIKRAFHDENQFYKIMEYK